MSAIDDYLARLEATLRVRGPLRRRFLAECREHLAEAAELQGPDEAVQRFGEPAAIAAMLDAEAATRLTLRATLSSVAGVAAVALSTLGLLTASDPQASGVTAWAVLFFGFAQAAGACAALALVQAAAMRRTVPSVCDLALLRRRDLAALIFAGLTLLAAGGALPGHASAGMTLAILAGPLIAGGALLVLLRAGRLARTIDGPVRRVVRPPIADAIAALPGAPGRIAEWRGSAAQGLTLLVPCVLLAAALAFGWSLRDDHGTAADAAVAAVVEASMVLVGFALLGPVLGLRGGRERRHA